MIKSFLIMSFFILSCVLNAATPCICGSFDQGHVAYYSSGSDCCKDNVVANLPAMVRNYDLNEGGTYTVREVKEIDPAAAKKICCKVS